MINVSQESSAHAFKSIMRLTIATLRLTSMKSVCILPVYLMPWSVSFFLFFRFISPDVIEVNNPPAGGHSFKLNFCPVGEASCEAVKGGREVSTAQEPTMIHSSNKFILSSLPEPTFHTLPTHQPESENPQFSFHFFHTESQINLHGCKSPVWVYSALHAAVAHLGGSLFLKSLKNNEILSSMLVSSVFTRFNLFPK